MRFSSELVQLFVSGQKCVLDSIFGISAISQKLESGPIECRQTLRNDLLHCVSCAVAVNNDELFTRDRWRRFMHAFASGESARHVAFQLRATLLSAHCQSHTFGPECREKL